MKESRDSENNIIMIDSSLRSILPPKLKNMSTWYKVMCGCEFCIYTKSIYSSLISWRDRYLKNIKYISQNDQNLRFIEIYNRPFETYTNM